MKTVTLNNGVRVVMEDIPYLRSACVGIWIKNGSRFETEQNSGISHFIEHMLFKGTTKRSAKQIADEMDAIGGQLNAFTSKEYTCYYTRTLDEHLAQGLDILSDMFFHSVFDNAEIKKECNVIVEEINMYEDTPDEVASDLLQYKVWENYPLGYSILGTKDSIASFDSDTFKQFIAEKYTPSNIVVALAGNFVEAEALELIRSHFEDYSHQKPGAVNRPTPAVYKPAVITKEKDIEQLNVQIGFPSIHLDHEQTYAMGALNTFFGGGMSSRLFQKIREEQGLAYSVYSYNMAYEDVGLFSVCASLVKDNAQAVMAHTFGEIAKLKANPMTSEQLSRTKEQLKSSYILSLESSSSRMSHLGRSLTMLNRVHTSDQVLAKIAAIDLDMVVELVETVLVPDNASFCAVGPVGETDFEAMMNQAKAS